MGFKPRTPRTAVARAIFPHLEVEVHITPANESHPKPEDFYIINASTERLGPAFERKKRGCRKGLTLELTYRDKT